MILAVDTETTGTDFFHGCRPFMVSACDGKHNYYATAEVNPYTRNVVWDDDILRSIQTLIDSADTIIFHNTTFDMRALESIGLDISRWWGKIEDTLLASHCICSGDSHGLKDLSIKYLNYWDDDEQLLEVAVRAAVIKARAQKYAVASIGHKHFPAIKKNGTSFWKMDYWLAMEECTTYGIRDAERTWLLWNSFKPSLLQDNLWQVYLKRKRLLKIVYDMQSFGKFFYVDKAEKRMATFRKEMEEIRWKIKELAGIEYRFDPNKRDHLIDLIHNRCKIPVLYYTKGSQESKTTPGMDKNALDAYMKEYDAEPIKLLKLYKNKQKQSGDIESYLLWIDETHRTHSSCNITGTRETRQSSSGPNDQNIDKFLRDLFGPPPEKIWLSFDLVNIELRIWAYLVGNKELIEAFEKGLSVHQMVMETIFPSEFKLYLKYKAIPKPELVPEHFRILKFYDRTKNGNFARIYGASDNKVNETYHGGKKAPNYCAKIDARFPGIREFTESCTKLMYANIVRNRVSAIHTLGGYRLDVPVEEPYKSVNFRVQGTAGEIMAEIMIEITEDKMYNLHDAHFLSQVHDSGDIEMPLNEFTIPTIESICNCARRAGRKFIPTCDISYYIINHPTDKGSPWLGTEI